MAWTSMHFAVGMCGGAALTLAPCLILRRGWRFIPVGMTLGGLWALIPDMPRLWREDFPSLPFASTLGAKDFEVWLHSIGDLFFFHRTFDAQPKEFALLGLMMIIGLYNLGLILVLISRKRLKARQTLYREDDRPASITHAIPHAAQTDSHQLHAECERGSPEHDAPPVVGRIGMDKSA
jgi:hypothetical protein